MTTQIKMRGVYNTRSLLPSFLLEGKYVLDDASVGDLVGIFHGSANYAIDTDASGQFAVDGDRLEVDDTLTAGEYEIIIDSDDGLQTFVIKVLEA